MSGYRGRGSWSGSQKSSGSSQKNPNSGSGGPAPKKFRGDDEDEEMFEDLFDEEEMMAEGQAQMEEEELKKVFVLFCFVCNMICLLPIFVYDWIRLKKIFFLCFCYECNMIWIFAF